ncbi:hypothetical protein BXZ70DRAFT_902050 [Cristinia sonorae]|uniref:Fungal-type protein kinase domain-containing protein n=1 Tax=Cristinia sonorae TaxID=1940300 RepID=A0A8K0UES4_9AGAR|nr:hypothetical protein BXZ70DRAFT_902050 [Cristinia sonorae]
MGVVQSAPFDFIAEPHYLLLFVAAITAAPRRQPRTPLILQHFPVHGEDDNDNVRPSALTLHCLHPDTTLNLSLAFDIDEEPCPNQIFLIDTTKTRRPSLFTVHETERLATSVIYVKAHSADAKQLCGTSNLVAKISWPVKVKGSNGGHIGEDWCIRTIRQALAAQPNSSTLLQHVVDMKLSVTQSMEEIGFPRAFMRNLCPDVGVNNIMFYRTGGVAIGVICGWDHASSQDGLPDDIGTIKEDLLRCKILPEDLGMYGLTLPCAAPPANTAPTSARPGAFNTRNQVHRLHGQRSRTGTGPFIALELLLCRNVPQHRYRHDLESFFWVLAWFICSFKPEEHTLGYIKNWLKPDLREIGESKRAFIIDSTVYDDILKTAAPAYRHIGTQWVEKLLVNIINPVYHHNFDALFRKWRRAKPESDERKAMDEQIKAFAVERESYLTYETFMALLGEIP